MQVLQSMKVVNTGNSTSRVISSLIDVHDEKIEDLDENLSSDKMVINNELSIDESGSFSEGLVKMEHS
jgi:hypothetical protein